MKKKEIGIFFGSDTGNTKKIAHTIQKLLRKIKSEIFDIAYCSQKDIENYDTLILGISTWYYGEPQSDWDEFLPIFKKINFSKKKVAIFGCGDQEDYSEYFCDSMNILYNITLKKEAKLIGHWPTLGYYFEESKSITKNNMFVGLAIDEDRQPEMTEKRVKIWTNQLLEEIKDS